MPGVTDELGTALPEERRLQIAAQLRRDSRVRVDDLARQFAVSGETIRRDLQVLEERGILRRVYGGAIVAASTPWEARVEADETPPALAIAAHAATLIDAGDTIVLHGNSLMVDVARVLPASYGGRVLCAGLSVAAELAGRAGIDVLLAGGQLRSPELMCSGSVTERFFAEYFADKAFLVAAGVHATAGLTGSDLGDVAVCQVIMRQAREVYVLADATALGRIAIARVAPLSAITAVITDTSADLEEVRGLEHAGVKVLMTDDRLRDD
jgi:DeoR family transcriptional regulator, fructose operon transcriptional repressor